MPIVDFELAPLRDPRLVVLATNAWPAWLWSADGARILWANAVGAAIFGATNVGDFSQRPFKPSDMAAAQVIRLGATLPSRAQERLERLRGFGASFGRPLTCLCSRIVLDDGKAGVLIVATQAAGPALSLSERVRRLLAANADALAVFAPDGTLIYANEAARARLGSAATLATLGLAGLTAPEIGSMPATAQIGGDPVGVTAEWLGKDNSRVLLLTLAAQSAPPIQAPRAVAQTMPEPTIPEQPIAPPPFAAQTLTTQTLAAPVELAVPLPETLITAAPAEATAETVFAPAIVQTEAVETQANDEALAEKAVMAPAPIALAPAAEPVAASSPAPDVPVAERRHPLRFVWQMDAEGRFVVGSDEFVELVGPRTMAATGRLWSEIADELNLDPGHQVTGAIASHETWSGIVVTWPVDDCSERLPVEMSGLPVFDRDRIFRGYRGFGVCRDIARINELSRERRERVVEPAPQPPPAEAVIAVPAALTPSPIKEAEPAAIPEPAEPERPVLTVTPGTANVVPFRQSQPAEPKTAPALSPVERRAFRELAQELTARLRSPENAADQSGAAIEPAEPLEAEAAEAARLETTLLDRIPLGVLVYRHDAVLFANRHFLDWSGHADTAAIEKSGGLNALFAGPLAAPLTKTPPDNGGLQIFAIRGSDGRDLPAEGRMFTVTWGGTSGGGTSGGGTSALALVLTNGKAADKKAADNKAVDERAEAERRTAERALAASESENCEIKSLLDLVGEGIVTLDRKGIIIGANAQAGALFGRAAEELRERSLCALLAPESERVASDYFERVAGGANTNDNPLEVAARASENRLVPLVLTFMRLGADRFAATFHDTTTRKQGEEDLRNAKRDAIKAAAAKSEFLAKVNHEIRTPLNAMTGFAEVIMAERFGPIGNERYREYVKDIHAAGTHLVGTLNDLLDLSRIESGTAPLNFANISLNDLTQQCVGIMQPQANKARIIIRTALTPALPHVVADERSMRQIVLNLLSNSIRLTGPGGQVIVSTVFSDAREAVLRVRDTGAGMSEKDIQAALAPFQETATASSFGSGGSGFGLPLTKAIAEANRANFSISSAPNAGTLVEIAFPPSRVVAE